jgi:holo-[acyl-carrier protein] synthase
MILGIGIDLVDVARVQAAMERFGERFLSRLLRPDEIEYCRKFPRPALPVAARFAAKEAISKAFGTGIGRYLSWQDMEIQHLELGQPVVLLHGAGKALFAQRHASSIHVSLSHTPHQATAIAILETTHSSIIDHGHFGV